jgi:glycosyltransferase involved in cell wall biosynthesis
MAELLESLERQTHRADQIIIIDQSEGGLTEDAVEKFAGRLPILYMKDPRKGLSRGRNLGLDHADGDIVAFPDDDCVYGSDAIARVITAFSQDDQLDIYTGMSVTPAGTPSQGRWGVARRRITKPAVWTCQTSYTTFYRRQVVEAAGRFNEDLGVGAGTKWGAGEETELMLRALSMGAVGWYDPELRIVHPEPLAIFDAAALDRGKRYNRGFGRVLRMGRFSGPFATYMIVRPLFGAGVALVKGRSDQAHYRWIASRERLLGWLDPKGPDHV